MRRMTPQDPPATTPRRIARPSSDRIAGGVAAGLARHFGLDAALVRVAFVVLALFGGSGILLYAILWLLLPSEDGPAAIGPEASTTRKLLLIGLIVVGIASLPFTGPSLFFAGPALFAVAVVSAIGVLAWRAAGGEGNATVTRVAALVLAIAGALVLGLGAGIAAALGAGTVVAVVVVAL